MGSERVSNGRPGRCDPHPFGNLAHDHGYRAATLSLLLRPPYKHEDTYLE